MTNKTISINPQLFSMGGAKTKKNKEKREKVNVIPLISPNVLKNKLLKRIKEHKQRETENLDSNKRKLSDNNDSISSNTSVEPSKDYMDEFSESISYLQTLSKQKKIDEEKANYEKKKEQKLKQLQTQTIKNYASIVNSNSPIINIDLPEELQMSVPQITNTVPITINQPRNDFIPYSNLKGGSKPSYRDWNKTQRANIVTNPNLAITVNNTTIKSERENRLHNLREKLKMKQLEKTMTTQNQILENTNIQATATPLVSVVSPVVAAEPLAQNEEIIGTKKITKKTIKRKYTLGKSHLKKTVSVLVKDRGTRKQVLSAQKDLKKKSINDIKVYLRDHNLIKVGSNAPNDVLRKLYESAMLAGEITNSNTETLLHNLSKDDKEL
jgi:hypothetical protein